MAGTRVGDRGRTVVLRIPPWVRGGLLGDREAVRRVTAFGLYAAFVPLAFGVEAASGALSRNGPLLVAATAFLVAQMALVWVVRPMPLWGWTVLTALVPAAFVLYGEADPAAAAPLAIVLAVPVGWAATFLPARIAALAVVANAAAVASIDFSAAHGAAWLLLATRSLTFAIIAVGAHLVVGSLRRAHAAAALRADTDPVTGSFSRSRLHDVLHGHLMDGDAATSARVGVVLMDIDHFKRVNDTFGHLAGDDALRRLVERLAPVLREGDTIGRWGGEEFLVVAPGTADTAALHALCEKLRRTVAERPFTLGGQAAQMTVSIGATIATPDAPLREFLAAADDALYAAKRAGRNMACVASLRITAFDVGADVSELASVRRRVRGACVDAGLPPEQVEDVALAVSEACAGMVTHGNGDRSLHVTTHDRAEVFTVTIQDPGSMPSTGSASSPSQGADDLAEAVVSALAREVRSEQSVAGDVELSLLFVKEPAACWPSRDVGLEMASENRTMQGRRELGV